MFFSNWSYAYEVISSQYGRVFGAETTLLLEKIDKQLRTLNHVEVSASTYAKYSKICITSLIQLLQHSPLSTNKTIIDNINSVIRALALETVEKLITANEGNALKSFIDVDESKQHVDMDRLLKDILFKCLNIHAEERKALACIRVFHTLNYNFNCFDDFGRTPLVSAIIHIRFASVIDALIVAGADVNKTDKNKVTPLRSAVFAYGTDSVKRLLQAGAEATCESVTDALCTIVVNHNEYNIKRYLKVITLLIKAGAPIETRVYRKYTLLKCAVLRGSWLIVDLLLTLGAKPYDEIIDDAIVSNNEELLINLIKKYKYTLPPIIPFPRAECELDANKGSTLTSSIFQLCHQNGMRADRYSLTDIQVLKTPGAVKECLQRKMNLNTWLPHPFRYRGEGLGIISGTSPGAESKCMFAHFAATVASGESLAILIQAGLNIHARDSAGLTPLHYAAAYASEETVCILILAGADIHAVDKKGMTPLHCAVENENPLPLPSNISCARILICAGANLQALDKSGRNVQACVSRFNVSDWKKLFETRVLASPQQKAVGNTCPTLFDLASQAATNVVLASCRSKPSLFYRQLLPEKLSLRIEEIAIQRLSPSK